MSEKRKGGVGSACGWGGGQGGQRARTMGERRTPKRRGKSQLCPAQLSSAPPLLPPVCPAQLSSAPAATCAAQLS